MNSNVTPSPSGCKVRSTSGCEVSSTIGCKLSSTNACQLNFISGATGGIGKAFAYQVASQGGNLFLTARNSQKLQNLASEIANKYGVYVDWFSCDLTNAHAVKHMLNYIGEKGYKFCRVINVAGVDTQMAFTKFSTQKLSMMIDVNCTSTVNITHALIDRATQNMQIITIASMSGASPMPYFALYSATKSMLINLFTALHYELKSKGIKVTVVMPGGVYTRKDVVKQIEEQGLWGKLSAKTPEYIAKKSLKVASKNKVKYIPGFFNKLLYGIIKITPKCIVLKFIAKRWAKIEKDAF